MASSKSFAGRGKFHRKSNHGYGNSSETGEHKSKFMNFELVKGVMHMMIVKQQNHSSSSDKTVPSDKTVGKHGQREVLFKIPLSEWPSFQKAFMQNTFRTDGLKNTSSFILKDKNNKLKLCTGRGYSLVINSNLINAIKNKQEPKNCC